MAKNVSLLNISRRKHRIGTTTLPAYIQTSSGTDTTVSAPVTIDITTLDRVARRQLMELIANGSVVSASALNSIVVASIDQGSRSRNRIGATATADLTQTTFDGTALTPFQRRDLIQNLANGSFMATHGTRAATVYNLSSKRVRIGSTVIPPVRISGGYSAVDVITLNNLVASASFKLTYGGTSTSAFVVGTNCTAAAIQSALRALTGDDANLTVAGTTDAGPFTVTYSDGFAPLSATTVTSPSFVQNITLSGTGGAYTFKLTYNGVEGATTFTKASNVTAAAIQSALRTATSDSGLLVTGTTDTGPFALKFANGFTPLSDVTVTSPTGGVSGSTADANVSGSDSLSGSSAGDDGNPSSLAIADVLLLSQNQRRDLQLALAAGNILVV